MHLPARLVHEKGTNSSVLVQGPEPEPEGGWDAEWRLALVERAEILVKQLREIGIEKIYLDGSFTEAKAHPNDIDKYSVCDVSEFASGAIQRKLNALDYPHFGQLSGINDSRGYDLLFPSAFRLQRGTDAAKGIVQVVQQGRDS